MRKRSQVVSSSVDESSKKEEKSTEVPSGGIPTLSNPPTPSATETRVSEDEGQVVSATWGEELVTISQGNAYRVGPFSASTTIRRGETRRQAIERVYADLVQFASQAHAAKAARFDKRGAN